MTVNAAKLCTDAWCSMVPRGGLVQSTFVAASGQAAGYAVSFLAMPLLTRLYSPADFGIFAVYLSVVSVLGACATLRYDAAIPLPRFERTAINVFALSVCVALITALLVGAALWLFVPVTTLRSPLFVAVLTVHTLCLGCFESFNNWIVREKTFHWLSLMRFLQNVAWVGCSLGLAWVSARAESLAISSATGCLAAVLAVSLCCPLVGRLSKEVSIRKIKYVAVRYRRFPLIEAPSRLIYTLAVSLPTILFAAFYSTEVAGWYGLGARALSMPLLLLGVAASRVYAAEAAACARNRSSALPQLFGRTAKRLLALSVPAVLVAAAACPLVFPVVFGEAWAEAGIYCMLLAPWTIANLLSIVLFGTVNIIERQQLTFLGSGLFAMILVAGLLIPYMLGLSPRVAVAALAISGSLGSSLMVWIAWSALNRDDRAESV